MRALHRISAFVFIASSFLFAQQEYTTAVSPKQQQANPGALTPPNEPGQQPTTKPQVSGAGPQPTATQRPRAARTESWSSL